MLGDCEPMTFVATTRPDKAKAFYAGVLGLKLTSEDPFALVFSARGIALRVQKVQQLTPQPFTVLGWRVPDIESMNAQLAKNGVKFERYPGMEQDAAGIWAVPGGGQVCWFKDPDGNTLSLTQAP
jgi:catechol 2,3-dioxygenase-like lactoylglutathione lyase family enzyme